MNRNKIDEVWNEFSKLNNIELKYKERSIQQVTQSNYLINYTNEIATFSFIGILSKSTDGHNTDKTSIIVEYKNRLDITNFELKNIDKTENTSEFEKNILKSLEKFNGSSITLRDEFIRIDTDYIFSAIADFEHVSNLISELKTTVKTT